MKFPLLNALGFTALFTSCQQTPTERAQAAVAEYVQYGMSVPSNYYSEGFHTQPFTRQDSIAYVLQVTERAAKQASTAANGASLTLTADDTRRAQERQRLQARQADNTEIGVFVRHKYREETKEGFSRRDSVDAVVYPPRSVVVLFTGQVPLRGESKAAAK
jgi:phage terminase large subunit-like protein